MIVYKLIRNGEHRADVVTLPNGKCVVSWPTSIVVYDSEEHARTVHIDHMGGRGERTQFDLVWAEPKDFMRGWTDALQDDCEGCPFASIGGLDAREDPRVPDWNIEDRTAWLLGYTTAARHRYGADWRTCTFGWAPALTINAVDEKR